MLDVQNVRSVPQEGAQIADTPTPESMTSKKSGARKERMARITSIAISALLIGVAIGTGYIIGRNNALAEKAPVSLVGVTSPAGTNVDTTDFSLFWKVWNALDDKYGGSEKPADTDKINGAIKGLVDAYDDPYTAFFTPVENEEFENSLNGAFEGVGMEVDEVDGIITVVSPIKDSPAYKAGIQPGDKILKIDETITADMRIDQAVRLIRGEKGTVVKLTVVREGAKDPIVFSLTRDTIVIPAVETDEAEGIPVIRVYTFNAQTPALFKEAMLKAMRNPSKKIILDFRGNPGGYLEAAVDMASLFLPAGNTIVSEKYRDGKSDIYRSKGYNLVTQDYKIVILIDGGSASASEIFSGALREYEKATLIGQKSFGKGSVQEYYNLPGGNALKVTVAQWLTPKGASISKNGLKPDIEVARVPEGATSTAQTHINGKRIDFQLNRAVEFLRNGR